MRYKPTGYNVDVMRQSLRLMVERSHGEQLCCPLLMHADEPGIRLHDSSNIKLNIWFIGLGHVFVSWPIGVQLVIFCSSVQ